MSLEEVKKNLLDAGFIIVSEKRLGNDTGTQLKLSSKQTISVFDKGTIYVQGKDRDQVEQVLCQTATGRISRAANGNGRENKVFIVYGHDLIARSQLEAMLRRWGLEPLILDQLPSEGQTVIEKLENNTNEVGFGIILATPDDIGYRACHEDEKAYRVRQNVVLELGMLLAKLGRKKVAILIKQQANMERPSDIQGLIYIPFNDNLEKEAGLVLAKEMVTQGFQIQISQL